MLAQNFWGGLLRGKRGIDSVSDFELGREERERRRVSGRWEDLGWGEERGRGKGWQGNRKEEGRLG